MFEVYKFNESEILLFVLALVRISSMIVVMPIFGYKQVPNTVKILLSLVMAMVIFPSARLYMPAVSGWQNDFILFTMREAFIGMTLGFLMRLVFMSVEIA